ncbi:hypothetical protein BD309DRAFT_948314 [Dichomitus squalens]|nr:hypothetical protein BD309DRAFT_948314 [Dichomitus squalens]
MVYGSKPIAALAYRMFLIKIFNLSIVICFNGRAVQSLGFGWIIAVDSISVRPSLCITGFNDENTSLRPQGLL